MSVDCSIGAAAEIVGLHPQTLRDYERLGLLQPSRSSGGTRRYGEREFVRITRIMQLTAAGLNLAGVREVLELEAQLTDAVNRIRQLESRLTQYGEPSDVSRPRVGTAAAVRSMSVELVHLPRRPRGPRWRNDQ